jgi:hypothetical protein
VDKVQTISLAYPLCAIHFNPKPGTGFQRIKKAGALSSGCPVGVRPDKIDEKIKVENLSPYSSAGTD